MQKTSRIGAFALALSLAVSVLFSVASCRLSGPSVGGGDPAVERFLDEYSQKFVDLTKESAEANWLLDTRIVEGDETNKKRVEAADGAFASFTGSIEVIEATRKFLEESTSLDDLQRRQLQRILYNAANNPQTIPDVVDERISAEAAQTEALYGYKFKLGGREVSANDIDEILVKSSDEAERLAAWTESKEVGKELKAGLANLVRLRNETAKALGYSDYFEYQVSDYGMTVDEMMTQMRRFARELRPLYREIHTWARYTLAEKYGKPVPEMLPAHWLPNRWGQSWSELVTVEGLDLNAKLEGKKPEWLIRQAEEFYVSLGFEALPESFWSKSDLYPLPGGTSYSKNNHASAWHVDLQRDVRCLMSVVSNARWWETTHHELGHIYYYLEYSRPEVPPLLREGANRAFHEAIGSLLGFASMQRAFLQGRGIISEEAKVDEIQALLREALDMVVFIPFSTGTMTHFEHDLYAEGLPVDQYNARWWKYVTEFQGIVPPSPRGEEFCDAASKTHINNDPAQYYDYALSFILLQQFHAHIATKILKADSRNTNYFGSREVGGFLRGVLQLGATKDWREVLRDSIGEDVSAKAILEYFEPLLAHLRKVNEGRKHTLGDV